MECSEPGTLRDEDLIAYLDGASVRPLVSAHLAHCPRCSQQLSRYRQLEQQLTGRLYRWDCPPNQVLGEYHLGMLASEEAACVKQHLSSCVLCAAELATFSSFLDNDPILQRPLSSVQDTAPAPVATQNHQDQSTIACASRRLRDHLNQLQEQSLTGVRPIPATLLPLSPQLAARRELVAQPSSWPRRYAADDVLISLQVERDPHSQESPQVQLLGLVTCSGASLAAFQGASVLLREQGTATDPVQPGVHTQHIDELGNFLFSALLPATYTLELHIPQGIVTIDSLVLPPQE